MIAALLWGDISECIHVNGVVVRVVGRWGCVLFVEWGWGVGSLWQRVAEFFFDAFDFVEEGVDGVVDVVDGVVVVPGRRSGVVFLAHGR